MTHTARPRILFVTGRLAEPSLRRVLDELAPKAGFEPTVAVLPITVAALLTGPWVARHLTVPPGTDRVVLPGFCRGDAAELAEVFGVPVDHGPKDLRDLPQFFGTQAGGRPSGYGGHDIAILAEVNHAPRLSREALLLLAKRYHHDGADLIDLGCDPGSVWAGVGDAVKSLRDEGLRVSVDSLNPLEIAPATRAGAELVLSVNASNREAAADWGCEVVAIPDDPADMRGLDETIEHLNQNNIPYRVDPILEPIGFGFAASLGRYLEARRRRPDAEMMMGVGNLTELTDVDSAGVNVLLAGFCQEVGVRSVLTTEVAPWCRSAVKEFDSARRLVAYAVRERVLPKRLEPDLVVLRDPRVHEQGPAALAELAGRVKDRNYRLFAEGDRLHVMNGSMHLEGDDPFALFAEVRRGDEKMDASHAFYLGYELAKAVTALTLGKQYTQDRALRWGHLTREERPPG